MMRRRLPTSPDGHASRRTPRRTSDQAPCPSRSHPPSPSSYQYLPDKTVCPTPHTVNSCSKGACHPGSTPPSVDHHSISCPDDSDATPSAQFRPDELIQSASDYADRKRHIAESPPFPNT